MSKLSYTVGVDFPNGVEINTLEYELTEAGIVIDHIERIDDIVVVNFGQPIGDSALLVINGVIQNHKSSGSAVKRYLANSLIVPHFVSVIDTNEWQVLGGTYSNATFLSDNLTNAMIAVKGLVDYNGSSTEIRLVRSVEGVKEQVSEIYEFNSVSDNDEEFSLYATNGLYEGACFYTLEARLNDSTDCTVKHVNLIILQNEAVV